MYSTLYCWKEKCILPNKFQLWVRVKFKMYGLICIAFPKTFESTISADSRMFIALLEWG